MQFLLLTSFIDPTGALSGATSVVAGGMQSAMRDYFRGEQCQSIAFILTALCMLGVATWAARRFGRGGRWFAVPVILLAAVQLAVGGSVLARTTGQVEALSHFLQQDVMGFTLAELQRIELVLRHFKLYRWIGLALLGGGAILIAVGARGKRAALIGLGLGLGVQSALTLGLDTVAADRALTYYRALGIHRSIASGLIE